MDGFSNDTRSLIRSWSRGFWVPRRHAWTISWRPMDSLQPGLGASERKVLCTRICFGSQLPHRHTSTHISHYVFISILLSHMHTPFWSHQVISYYRHLSAVGVRWEEVLGVSSALGLYQRPNPVLTWWCHPQSEFRQSAHNGISQNISHTHSSKSSKEILP